MGGRGGFSASSGKRAEAIKSYLLGEGIPIVFALQDAGFDTSVSAAETLRSRTYPTIAANADRKGFNERKSRALNLLGSLYQTYGETAVERVLKDSWF